MVNTKVADLIKTNIKKLGDPEQKERIGEIINMLEQKIGKKSHKADWYSIILWITNVLSSKGTIERIVEIIINMLKQDRAATKIQALQRGRKVRALKKPQQHVLRLSKRMLEKGAARRAAAAQRAAEAQSAATQRAITTESATSSLDSFHSARPNKGSMMGSKSGIKRIGSDGSTASVTSAASTMSAASTASAAGGRKKSKRRNKKHRKKTKRRHR